MSDLDIDAHTHPNRANERMMRDAAEIERLMAENASLWERVRRWEPMADPNWHCSGSLEFKEFKGAKSDE